MYLFSPIIAKQFRTIAAYITYLIFHASYCSTCQMNRKKERAVGPFPKSQIDEQGEYKEHAVGIYGPFPLSINKFPECNLTIGRPVIQSVRTYS